MKCLLITGNPETTKLASGKTAESRVNEDKSHREMEIWIGVGDLSNCGHQIGTGEALKPVMIMIEKSRTFKGSADTC